MREIRTLIADDEPLARRGIRQLLTPHDDIVVVGEARDGRETLRMLESLAPELLFLDVQMPELDGFDVLRARGVERMPMVVFVTAFDEFAIGAFEAHALDYLVKPVSDARFAHAIAHVRERLRSSDALALTRQLASLLAFRADVASAPPVADSRDAIPARRASRRLVVPTPSGEFVLDVAEVEWIQAEDYYAAIHARGKRYLVRESLASLEARLDPTLFARVHRSAIVCLERVRELRTSTSGEATIVLRDGTRIPVSRRRREAVGVLLRRSAG